MPAASHWSHALRAINLIHQSAPGFARQVERAIEMADAPRPVADAAHAGACWRAVEFLVSLRGLAADDPHVEAIRWYGRRLQPPAG